MVGRTRLARNVAYSLSDAITPASTDAY